jgi:hypothetical protein
MEPNLKEVPMDGFPGYYASESGSVYSTKFGRLRKMRGSINKDGYRCITIRHNGRRKCVPACRMVLLAFIGQPPSGHECCHGPGGRCDDSLGNLSWGTKSKNHGDDRRRDGTDNSGERCGTHKLCDADVVLIRQAVAAGMRHSDVAEAFHCSRSNIGLIASFKSRVTAS